MRGGETTALFVPNVTYVGFSTTIPTGWRDVECFYYEQRGWLKWWGKGQSALLEQAEVQARAGRWTSAETTYRRVRSMADTLAEALEGQVLALRNSQRHEEARALALELVRRWPSRARAREIQELVD